MVHFGPHSRRILEAEWATSRGEIDGWRIESADLARIELARGTWREAQITDSVLNDANLSGSTLDGCELFRNDLNRTGFSGSRLEATTIDSCVMNRTDLSDVWCVRSTIRRAVMNRPSCTGQRFDTCLVEDVESSKGVWDRSVWHRSRLSFRRPGGIDGFREGSFVGALFIRSTVQGSAFVDADLTGAVFIECTFDGQEWEYVDTTETLFVNCSGAPRQSTPVPKRSLGTRSLETIVSGIATSAVTG